MVAARSPTEPLPLAVSASRTLLNSVRLLSLPLQAEPEGWAEAADIWIAKALEPSRASKVLLTKVTSWQATVAFWLEFWRTTAWRPLP